MNSFDSNDFAEALCSDSSYEYMESCLQKDMRRHTPKGDLAQRYSNYRSWKDSELKRNVDRVVDLIPKIEGQEIAVSDLKQAVKSYGLDEDVATKVIREVGTNDKRVRARRNSYARSKTLDDILLRRVDNFE